MIQPWHWLAFAAAVAVLLGLDLFVFHRHDHTPSLRESALYTVFWIGVGLAFNVLVWWWGLSHGRGSVLGLTFLNAYLIEKSLSMDNIFVFVVIFRYFQIPMMYQYRVLFWGILGAVFMRLTFILLGVGLIQLFDRVILIFGAFLIYVSYKLARHSAEEVDPEKNFVLRHARRWLPVTPSDHGRHGHDFFVREAGKLFVTPMFLVLLVIESTDVVFAVDSIPAVIGIIPKGFEPAMITFIAFTSNVFAILGLRALYFLLAGVVEMFRYLHYGLAAVLGFVGVKMIAEYIIEELGGPHVFTPQISLAVVAGILGISIVASLVAGRRQPEASTEQGAERENEKKASKSI